MEKRYLKIFNTQEEYEAQKVEVMDEPHVVLLEETKKVIYEPLKETPSDPFNGYEYVDLGLPSGTLWATSVLSNVDGEPLYFQWGDTEGWTAEQIQNGEKVFNDSSYKWDDGSSMTKYNSTDSKVVLDLEDDAAHVHMGGDWHMPTKEQFEELTVNTTSTWITKDGIGGRLFTASNGNSLFIPSHRYAMDGYIDDMLEIVVWGCSLYEKFLFESYSLQSSPSRFSISSFIRTCGAIVLGVVSK